MKNPSSQGWFLILLGHSVTRALALLLGLRGGPFGFRASSWGRHFDILTASASDLIRFLERDAEALPHARGVFGELQCHLPDIN